MPDRRAWLACAAALATAPWVLAACNRAEGQKMAEIKFDLGKNIVETARASGVPEFAVRDIAGLVSYSVADIPQDIPARFARPGLEVSWQPLFAFTMYADRNISADLRVETVALQLRTHLQTDAQAQAFAEATIAQFQKGKWKRYADPEWDVLLTGRSSYLDESGQISRSARSVDPAYKINAQDWLVLARIGPRWRWVGDGVFAQLSVDNSPGVDGKPAYRMNIEFELLDVKLKRDADNLAQRLKEGDAKGWGSTAEHEANKKKRAEQIKRLIDNATKRGDSVAQQ
jgi:hypothetical protein